MKWLEWIDAQILKTTRRVFNNPLLLFGLMGLSIALKLYSSRVRNNR